MSTIKKFAGQTLVYGLSTILSRLLNFILTPIYVKIYPAKVYGIFTTMYAFASMLNAVLAFGMETTFFRYLNKHDDKKKVYSTTFFFVISIALVFLLFTSVFIDNIAGWVHNKGVGSFADYKLFVWLFIWILIIDAIAVIPFAKVRADGQPGRYALIKFLNIIVFVFLNLFFLFVMPWLIKSGYHFVWYKPGWVGYVFISNLLASGLTLFMLLPQLVKLSFNVDKKMMREMLSYSFPVLIANLSFIINEHADKIFIEKLLGGTYGTQEVGIYGAVCKLAVFLSIFINAFRLGAEPFFFSQAKNKNSGETYARIMNYFVIAISLIFVALVANIELLKYFINGKNSLEQAQYWSGLKVVPVLLLGYLSLGIYMNLSIWYKLSDQTRYGLYISLTGAILTIILNIIFIPKYSYVASAWISLTAYASMMILSYLLGQNNYPIPYNLKKNISYIIISIIIVFLSFNVFSRNLLIGNVLFVMFILGTLYFERKEIRAIIGK